MAVSKIASIDGKVFCPFHTDLIRQAGKPPHAHRMALRDVIRDAYSDTEQGLKSDIVSAIRSGAFSAIILESRPGDFDSIVGKYYALTDSLFDDSTLFWTVSGSRIRPNQIWKFEPH